MTEEPDDLTKAQSVLREFGWGVQDDCRATSDALIRLGMHEDAAEVVKVSGRLITLLKRISGKDFLMTARGTEPR